MEINKFSEFSDDDKLQAKIRDLKYTISGIKEIITKSNRISKVMDHFKMSDTSKKLINIKTQLDDVLEDLKNEIK